MMNWIWFALIVLSVIFGIFTGKIGDVSQAAISGANDAVVLFLTLLAVICLWNGLMKIAESAGLTHALAKLFSPATKRIFPDIPPESPCMHAICMNIVANFLGLGNAATPFGLAAMKEMAKSPPKHSLRRGIASNSMAMFIVINTASIQLIPTTIAALRIRHQSAAPFEILPCIWLSSVVTLLFGVFCAKMLSKLTQE